MMEFDFQNRPNIDYVIKVLEEECTTIKIETGILPPF